MKAFFKKIQESPDQYQNVYIKGEILSAMKLKANDLPKAFKQAFLQKFPRDGAASGGVVGLTANLAARIELTDLHIPENANLQRDEADLDDALGSLDDLFKKEDDLVLESSLRVDPAREDKDDDEFTPLLESNRSKPILAFRDAASASANEDAEPEPEPSRLSKHFLDMDGNDKSVYQRLFSAEEYEPHDTLADIIRQKNEEVSDIPGQSKTQRLKKHLDNILPMVEFAVAGARKEWSEADGSTKDALLQKMESFEAIFKLLQSIRVLANNKSRFSEDYFFNKVEHILNKISPGLSNEDKSQHSLTQVLKKVCEEHLSTSEPSNFYQHKKGSTAFDPDLSNQAIKGHQKRLKIEHKRSDEPGSQAVVVTGKFDYSRKAVIGVQTGKFSGVKKIFAQRKDQLNEMNAQVSDFVTVALNDYKKGTPENPIYLQPSNGNQSELSLAILLEFKRSAILEGKVLIASDDTGKRIKITPDTSFSEDEKKYFSHFATQVPKVKASGLKIVSADQTAAYQLFKDVEVAGKKPLKDRDKKSISSDDLIEVMSSHLEKNIEKSIQAKREMISEAIKPLREQLGMNASTLRSSSP